MKQLMGRMHEDDMWGVAAQLAFFFLLSLFPFMLFLVTLLAYLPVTQDNLLGFITVYAPAETIQLIETNLNTLVEQRNSGLLSIGFLGAVWSASTGIKAVMKSMNYAYNVKEERSFIVLRLVAIALTFAMILVIAVAFLLPIFGKEIGEYLFAFIGLSEGFLKWWNTLRWVVSSIVFFLVLLALYRLAPSRRVYMKDAAIGAVVATVLWQIASLSFSFYVKVMGNFAATYGSLGGVIVLMLWFYISGVIIILGGEINALIELKRKRSK